MSASAKPIYQFQHQYELRKQGNPRWFNFTLVARRMRYSLMSKRRPFGGMTISECIIPFVFVFVNLAYGLHEIGDEDGEWAVNLGHNALFSMAFLLVGVTRHNILTYFFGISFDRFVKFHRFMGVWAVVMAVIHSVGSLPSYSYLTDEAFGAITLVAMLLIVLVTLIRCRHYCFFLAIHRLLTAIALIALSLHTEEGAGVVMAVMLLFGFDFWMRHVPNHKVQVIKATDIGHTMTMIEMTKKMEYSPGQYLFVKFPEISSESHPISIYSIPADPNITVIVKVLGDWSHQVHAAASSLTMAVLEGPYGVINSPVDRCDAFVLFAGGIGITPMHSLFRALMHDASQGKDVKRVHLVWIAPELKDFHDVILKDFVVPVDQDVFKVTLHATRGDVSMDTEAPHRPPISVVKGRPDISAILRDCANYNHTEVFACGPQPLIDSVRSACSGSHGYPSYYLHTEEFKW